MCLLLTILPHRYYRVISTPLPQYLSSPFSLFVLSSQYFFQPGPVWIADCKPRVTLGRAIPDFTPATINIFKAVYLFSCILINVFEFPIFSASWYFSNKYFPNQTFSFFSQVNLYIYTITKLLLLTTHFPHIS